MFMIVMLVIFGLGMMAGTIGSGSRSNQQRENQHPEYTQGQTFLADLYPGRRFRIVWGLLSGGPPMTDHRRVGHAIPLDEPRFPPIQFYCYPHRTQEPCFLGNAE